MHCTRTKLFNIHVCKGGPNFLGNMPPGGPYFLGNLARGDHILGGANFLGHRHTEEVAGKCPSVENMYTSRLVAFSL